MSELTGQSVAKPGRSLTGFYVAIGVVVVLALFGFWFWRTWTVWWFDTDEAKRRQAAAAAELGVPVEKSVDLGGGVKLDLVLIPAGRFKMGSPESEKDRRPGEPQHWVVITRAFYLGKYAVTQEQWQKVMKEDPSRFKGAKHPVECVSWDDCQDFLKKLNGLGLDKGQFRLPTEAEREWACRSGARTRFCFGDADGALAEYAWFDGNSGGTTHPVGTKKPNAWGLYDMHGNLWEWCGDWYDEDYYTKSPRYDPVGPATGSVDTILILGDTSRVSRGGSWSDDPGGCRSAGRLRYNPGGGSGDIIGLRVAVSAGH